MTLGKLIQQSLEDRNLLPLAGLVVGMLIVGAFVFTVMPSSPSPTEDKEIILENNISNGSETSTLAANKTVGGFQTDYIDISEDSEVLVEADAITNKTRIEMTLKVRSKDYGSSKSRVHTLTNGSKTIQLPQSLEPPLEARMQFTLSRNNTELESPELIQAKFK